ncbi:MAG: flavodoxin family protein [Gammaproteobacteria bacterium]|jgi:NAD(P)H dehydrogenase (quinone)
MKSIAVLFHSGFGHTTNVAQAVIDGIGAVEDVTSSLVEIDADGGLSDEQWAELGSADAIIFGSPTYMGMASWQFKKVADASSKRWFTQEWKNKLAAGFTNSATMNGDKHSTLHYFMTLAMQHSMIWVGSGMMPSNSKAATRDDINYVGSFGGLMTTSPSDASADEAPPKGDIETAKLFGQRVAQVAGDLIK